MGKLEDAIRALERYEKNPNESNKISAGFAIQDMLPYIEKYAGLCQSFTVRVQAENLGWMIVENME